MNNKQILKGAIEKAQKNGFAEHFGVDSIVKITLTERYGIAGLLFDKDFAKAFWGESEFEREERHCDNCGREDYASHHHYCSACGGKMIKKAVKYRVFNWQYNLQQMVLEEEPLKYLEQYL